MINQIGNNNQITNGKNSPIIKLNKNSIGESNNWLRRLLGIVGTIFCTIIGLFIEYGFFTK